MINESTYFEVLQWASSFLEKNNLEPYTAEYLMLERNNWSKTDLLLNFKKKVSSDFLKQYQLDLERLAQHVPVQYLIGSCGFYGRRFLVNEATLIPRPETEELVELILSENKNMPKRLVDIGTGTGVIAISLKLERDLWEISGLDISTEALKLANKNKLELNASVDLLESDVLSVVPAEKNIDIIVSNPPYISVDEWEEMDESVRMFEPKRALFAENNGLAIYEKIANEAKTRLTDQGKVYLEIGYLQGKAVSEIFKRAFPHKEVTVIKDLNNQDRMIKVI